MSRGIYEKERESKDLMSRGRTSQGKLIKSKARTNNLSGPALLSSLFLELTTSMSKIG